MSSIDKKPKFEPDPPPDTTGLSQEEALQRYVQWQQMQLDRIADWWPKENSARLARLEQFAPLLGTWPIVDYSYVSVTLSDLLGCDPLSFTQTDVYDTTSDNSVGFQQIAISPDGQYLYASNSGAGGIGRGIAQYTMSTPLDMTTISYTGFKALPTIFLFGVEIKDDGTQVYVIDGNTNDLLAYDLSTAWDITSASSTADDTKSLVGSPAVQGLCMSYDGKHLYTGRNVINSHNMYQWTMSTAWDITTATLTTTLDTRTIPNWPTSTNWRCICCDVSTNGKTIITNGLTGGIIVLNMSTPWSLASAEYVREPSALGGGFTEGLALSDECENAYMSTPSIDEFKEFAIG